MSIFSRGNILPTPVVMGKPTPPVNPSGGSLFGGSLQPGNPPVSLPFGPGVARSSVRNGWGGPVAAGGNVKPGHF
jgi:hypothetical protein